MHGTVRRDATQPIDRVTLVASVLLAAVVLLGVFAIPNPIGSTASTHHHPGDSSLGTQSTLVAPRGDAAPTFSQANNSSNLSGIWQSDDGVVFQFDQSPGSSTFTSVVMNDSCTGGPRTDYLSGNVTNTTSGFHLSGTMSRCSPANSTLDLNCSLDAIWSTPFNATITNGDLINGSYQGQFWTWNVSSSGQWTNCHIQSYYNATFLINRIDCGLQSFQSLGNSYIGNPTQRAQDVAGAMQLEAAAQANAANPGSVTTPVIWSAAQSVPGGFKSEVAAFQTSLRNWGRSSTVLSAYRPITYQAYFADLKFCAQWTYNSVVTTPSDAKFLAASVAYLNYQIVHVHAFQNPLVKQAANLTFYIPNLVCSTPPFTSCEHVSGNAVDLSIKNPSNPLTAAMSVDEIGALEGFCRPAATIANDANHWIYVGGNGFSPNSCPGVGPGDATITLVGDDAPINLFVIGPSGEAIGYDPESATVINTFPPGSAAYSGLGTEPQVFTIASNVTEPGNYTVDGVATGNGPYTIIYTVQDASGTALDGDNGTIFTENESGTATTGTDLAPVSFPLQLSYSTPNPWTPAIAGASVAGVTTYSLDTPNGTYSLSANSSTVDALTYTALGEAIALQSTGTGGFTSVTIPHSLLLGPFTVRANGSVIPSSATNSDSFSTVTFQTPSNESIITIQGTSPGSGSGGSGAGSSSAGTPLEIVVAAVGLVVVAAVVIGVMLLRRRRGTPPPPPPAPPSPPPPN